MGATIRVEIVTESPPEGVTDYAPKVFTGKRQVSTILEVLSEAMDQIVLDKKAGPLKYAGYKIVSVTITQN